MWHIWNPQKLPVWCKKKSQKYVRDKMVPEQKNLWCLWGIIIQHELIICQSNQTQSNSYVMQTNRIFFHLWQRSWRFNATPSLSFGPKFLQVKVNLAYFLQKHSGHSQSLNHEPQYRQFGCNFRQTCTDAFLRKLSGTLWSYRQVRWWELYQMYIYSML